MKLRYDAPANTTISDTSKEGTAYYHLHCFVAEHGVRKAMGLTMGLITVSGHWFSETFLYTPVTCTSCSQRIEAIR